MPVLRWIVMVDDERGSKSWVSLLLGLDYVAKCTPMYRLNKVLTDIKFIIEL